MDVAKQTKPGRKLVGEVIHDRVEILEEDVNEDTDKNRLVRIRGTASKGGVVNENNRLYPTPVLTKAVENAQKKLQEGKFVGQVDHPDHGEGGLRNTAIKFDAVWIEGDEVKFEADVLPTEDGQVLETLLRSGVGIGMSTRGYGTLEERKSNGETIFEVQDDYELVAIDAVLEQSNEYGKVASFENRRREFEMDLDQLKEEYPDLVKNLRDEIEESVRSDVESEVRDELEKEFEQKVVDRIDEKKSEFIEEGREKAMESDEVKKAMDFMESVSELAEEYLPEAVGTEDADDQLKEENEELQDQVSDLEEQLNKLKTERDSLEEELENKEVEEGIHEKIDEVAEGHKYESFLRERLEDCESPEEVEERFEREEKFINDLLSKADTPAGSGKSPIDEDEDKPAKEEDLDEQKERQKRLAGIPNEEGGNQ